MLFRSPTLEKKTALKTIKHKAFAYITCHHSLLVFSHPYEPEAGIQVPAGTVEVGEGPEEAVGLYYPMICQS